MSIWFWITTMIFTVVSASMVLIILVQRPQGGGLAGAFGGAGGASTETVFGGRVGDALTWATVTAFVLYVSLAITLNLLDTSGPAPAPPTAASTGGPSASQDVPLEIPSAPDGGALPGTAPDTGAAPADDAWRSMDPPLDDDGGGGRER